MDDEQLKLGDKIELYKEKEKSRVYKTMIEDIYEGGVFVAAIPRLAGVPMLVRRGERLTTVFYRDSGRYFTVMRVMGVEVINGIRYLLLVKLNDTKWDQRREAYRLPVRIRVLVCEYSDAHRQEEDTTEPGNEENAAAGEPVRLELANSKDLSITGISLSMKLKCESGKKHILKLYLEGTQSKEPPLTVCAEVVRVLPGLERGVHYVGMHFCDQTKDMNEHLTKYVMTAQQKLIKSRRLI